MENEIEYALQNVLGFCRHRNRSGSIADDVFQQTWLKVWKSRNGKFDGRNFKAWLFQIAKRSQIDCYRKKFPEALTENQAPTQNDLTGLARLEHQERLDVMRACFDSVGEEFSNVYRMQLDGASTSGIAEQQGIKEATVYTRIYRAKTLIRECVESRLA